MKLACVVHRYGADIAGGSEGHCRAIAEHLAARHDVTVLTTCARDHVSWKNEYEPGETTIGGVRVRRFPVARTRSLHHFADISQRVFTGKAPAAEQDEWFRANGPETPALVDYLKAHGTGYDRILFWSFRYYETYFGLPPVADRAVLLPTAEEDPAMRLDVLDGFFTRPAGLIFLTPEEQSLVERRVTRALGPSEVIGAGLDPAPATPGAAATLAPLGIAPPFVLYLGRIDPNKGCDTLLRYFARFHDDVARGGASGAPPVPLVMAGPPNMPVPAHPGIRPLGFVDDTVREALLALATVLVLPSPFESLSVALLEGWNHAVPGLVNGRCAVLRGQATRSGGALYYRDYEEFAVGLRHLLTHPDAAAHLGRQGLDYVSREYRWPHVIEKIERLLARVGEPRQTA